MPWRALLRRFCTAIELLAAILPNWLCRGCSPMTFVWHSFRVNFGSWLRAFPMHSAFLTFPNPLFFLPTALLRNSNLPAVCMPTDCSSNHRAAALLPLFCSLCSPLFLYAFCVTPIYAALLVVLAAFWATTCTLHFTFVLACRHFVIVCYVCLRHAWPADIAFPMRA